MKSFAVFLLIFLFVVISCSEKKEPLGISTHPAEWLQKHGEVVVQDSSFTLESCQTCHGQDYKGGTSNISCINCHSYPHAGAWSQKNSTDFHGTVAKQAGNENCQSCHGENYAGGSSGVSCFDCHNYPHLNNWVSEGSQEFHGQVTLTVGKSECQSCHGVDFAGGSSEVSCFTCHNYPHDAQFAQPGTDGFHENFLKTVNWNLSSCQNCHGEDYAGGKVGYSCNTCHSSPGGPEACNTCHGSVVNIAPPEDLSNNTSFEFLGVGAHQTHVANAVVSETMQCNVCHQPIGGFDGETHIDGDAKSEIVFNDFTKQNSLLNPVWNRTNATCGETYCHGGFSFKKSESNNQWAYTDSVITGSADPAVWTQTPAEDNCGSCHGLPPTGHITGFDRNDCVLCHSSVVNGEGNIIDPVKHIDGEINLTQ